MRRLKQQDGMAMIGWILLIGLIITISVLALKILPMYRSKPTKHYKSRKQRQKK
jgi:hypothetical protein